MKQKLTEYLQAHRRIASTAAALLIIIIVALAFGRHARPADDTPGSISGSDAAAQHYIESAGMTFQLPAYIPATGQHVSQDFSPLKGSGIDAQELEAHYKANNVLFNAVWTDSTQNEITVTMTSDGFSYALFHLTRATDEELERIKASFADYGSDLSDKPGASFSSIELYEHPQALFVRASCNVNTSASFENRVVYMTIINGKRITVTLIEAYPSGEGTDTALYPKQISAASEQILTDMLDSLQFDRVQNAFLFRYRFVIGFAVIALLAAGVLWIMLQQRNSRLQTQAKKEDTDDDRQPDDCPADK